MRARLKKIEGLDTVSFYLPAPSAYGEVEGTPGAPRPGFEAKPKAAAVPVAAADAAPGLLAVVFGLGRTA